MEISSINGIMSRLFTEIEKFIPVYMENPEDNRIANGNCAVCIIDENGAVHGKMFGTNKPRLRQSYKVAWIRRARCGSQAIKPANTKKWFSITL